MQNRRDNTANTGKYGVGFDDGTERRFRTSLEFRKWLHDMIDREPEDESDWLWLALNNLDKGIKFTRIY